MITEDNPRWSRVTIEQLVEGHKIAKPADGNHGEIHPKKADFVGTGIPFIMASDLRGGSVDQEHCNFLSRRQADSLRTGFAKNGDVLLSHKGTIGRVAILRTEHDYVMLTPQVTYYRILDRNALDARFLYYSFMTRNFQDTLYRYANEGSTRAYIGITKQLRLRCTFPSLEEQSQIVTVLDGLSANIERLERLYQSRLADLVELKQAILRKAVAGELTAHPEKALQEAAE
jgi:type I restriction enzyme, S subunit